jgi:hypothetical protein
MACEVKGCAAVAWLPGIAHKYYEDRYRLLPKTVPLVGSQDQGELFAIFDGIGGVPKGRQDAQEMSDSFLRFLSTARTASGLPWRRVSDPDAGKSFHF